MSMTDPIADLLTRIRNASQAGHASVVIPRSRLKLEIVNVSPEKALPSAAKSVKNVIGKDEEGSLLRITAFGPLCSKLNFDVGQVGETEKDLHQKPNCMIVSR